MDAGATKGTGAVVLLSTRFQLRSLSEIFQQSQLFTAIGPSFGDTCSRTEISSAKGREIGAMNAAQQDICRRGVAGGDAARRKWLCALLGFVFAAVFALPGASALAQG